MIRAAAAGAAAVLLAQLAGRILSDRWRAAGELVDQLRRPFV